jgi:hypothetical protein
MPGVVEVKRLAHRQVLVVLVAVVQELLIMELA